MESLNLKTLVEVVQTGSFSKAADNLFVTQSAVSRRIKNLEEGCGHPLLDRSGTVVKPTRAGKLVLAKAREILAIEETLVSQLEAAADKPRLNFACTHPFGIALLPEVFKRYMQKYRDLSGFKISFHSPFKALQGLQEGLFDLIVIEHLEMLDLSRYLTLPLPEDEMVFVASPRLGLSEPHVPIDELVRQKLFRRKEDCCSWKYLALNLEMIGRDAGEFTQTVIYDDLHVIIDSLIEGEGIALMSRDLVRKHVEAGELGVYRVEGFNHRRKRSLIISDVALPNAALADFAECLFESLELPPPELAGLFPREKPGLRLVRE
ncbi:LysR family transcriptional regulator [Geomesophilobacter sediminis]|uniref:LysR family transcriptional regulator n=1 Tax=Geomesophilobacter sediminis TaxID=2798584 RepID=A0A8J7JE05_9BACT|nr:LysR family transcriptional regulator [Geomesophilobacter sediminis]MBJ6725526.1 LysR family transcriptional regulator [Geomesophilobacter sediminis]